LTKWIDALQAEGKSKQVRKRNVKPASPVQEVVVMVRRPSDNDPGEVTQGYYTIEGKALQMTDTRGLPLPDSPPVTLQSEANARSIAASLTKRRWSETRGGFWRPISYEPENLP
jgi:hypothetical protein